ncbi:MAG: acyl-CoA dehydrogenase family protein [Acidimicrobiaceae bacterium]|nr:acyl-CoA dehydrogenase family protein [Acidimicrobiaceae bacterium]
MLPEPWGRGWNRAEAGTFASAMVAKGALGPPTGIGMMLAAPTILAHGSGELVERYVPNILNGRDGWCQLFSEPGAGSDLAGLQTKAERDGDEWVVNGQKVWTSGGQWADFGILVARSDADLPKHKGLSYFAFPMHQPGVEVRPLREMTGHAMFNEVFLADARVADADMIGDLNDGWRAANTTLMIERASIGGAGAAAPSAAIAGSVAGHSVGRPAVSTTRPSGWVEEASGTSECGSSSNWRGATAGSRTPPCAKRSPASTPWSRSPHGTSAALAPGTLPPAERETWRSSATAT